MCWKTFNQCYYLFLITQSVKVKWKYASNTTNGINIVWKRKIKSDNTCKHIEEVSMSIKRNIEYLYHYKFIDVNTFDFVGDSIVETSNHGLKRGDVTVSVDPGILVRVWVRLRNTILYNPELKPALDLFRVRPRANSRRPVCT